MYGHGWVFWAVVALSVVCVIHLWTRALGGPGKKLLWTGIMLVPVMGPLFYGAIYDVPSEQDEGARARESDTDAEELD